RSFLPTIIVSPLPEKFDVIIAGEVLEHLDAPGMFMKNCGAMLNPGGQLVITVPNPWHINAVVNSCFGRYTLVDSADHVAWYDASTLFELGQRHGLELKQITGITGHTAKTFYARLFMNLGPVSAMGFAPQTIREVHNLRILEGVKFVYHPPSRVAYN